MEPITNSSASVSTWRQEIAKKLFDWIILLVYVFPTKIKDARDAVVAAIRVIEVDLLKDSIGILQDWFTWFLGSIFALKFTDTGKTFFTANNYAVKAIFVIRFTSFLTTLLATLFHMYKTNIIPVLLMLVVESAASILIASLFSGTALWIALILWLCVFVLFAYCCYPEIKELIWSENQNQEPPSLQIVTD